MEATVEQITAAITALNDKYWYVVMALLFVAGVWFTIRTVGVQVRMLPEMLRSVTAKSQTGFENDGVSPFRAFTISAASRVGTGNVAGVAIAIVIGGIGLSQTGSQKAVQDLPEDITLAFAATGNGAVLAKRCWA